MRWLTLFAVLAMTAISPQSSKVDSVVPAPSLPAVQTTGEPSSHRSVLLELFTSEGCSSCPPADALLKQLDDTGQLDSVDVIAIEEHVDYWNHQGWTDPFSSPEWTWRQERYVKSFRRDGVYTPQLVVDGRSEMVGSDTHRIREAIAEASRVELVPLKIDTVNFSKNSAELSINLPQPAPLPKSAQLWLAVTERGLASDVLRGENQGRRLPHAAVLRSLNHVRLNSQAGPSNATAKVSIDKSWNRANLRFVAFLQENDTLHVLGSAVASAAH